MRSAAAAVLAAVALVGCGSGGDHREPGPASTAASQRIAPPGAPYSFVAPPGFVPAEFPVETLKAGSRFDYVSFYRTAADDGTATVSVMAVGTRASRCPASRPPLPRGCGASSARTLPPSQR